MGAARLGAVLALTAGVAGAEPCAEVLIYDTGSRRVAAEMEMLFSGRLSGLGAVVERRWGRVQVHLPGTAPEDVAARLAAETVLVLAEPRPPAEEGGPLRAGPPLSEALTVLDADPLEQRGVPGVAVRLDAEGARVLGQITLERTGLPMAVVVDGEVVMAPQIREPILKGSFLISGDFSLEQAAQLAVRLRSGDVPPRLAAPTREPSTRDDCGEKG